MYIYKKGINDYEKLDEVPFLEMLNVRAETEHGTYGIQSNLRDMVQANVSQQISKNFMCNFTYFVTSSKLCGMAIGFRGRVLDKPPKEEEDELLLSGKGKKEDKLGFHSFGANIVANSLGQILNGELNYSRTFSPFLSFFSGMDFSHDGLNSNAGFQFNVGGGTIQSAVESSGALLVSVSTKITKQLHVDIGTAIKKKEGTNDFDLNMGFHISAEL